MMFLTITCSACAKTVLVRVQQMQTAEMMSEAVFICPACAKEQPESVRKIGRDNIRALADYDLGRKGRS